MIIINNTVRKHGERKSALDLSFSRNIGNYSPRKLLHYLEEFCCNLNRVAKFLKVNPGLKNEPDACNQSPLVSISMQADSCI